jgi:hypothetical protein
VRAIDKKEYMVVVIIFIAAVLMFSLISRNHADIITETPNQSAILNDNDMTVANATGNLIVGRSTRDEVMQVYPDGDNLGRSGLYRPKNMDCLLSFSKKEEVLIRVDIGFCDLSTSRGIKANDSFDKVVDQYGDGYTKSYDKKTPQIFDAYYGSDQYILFKIENNLVKKIYIGSTVQ